MLLANAVRLARKLIRLLSRREFRRGLRFGVAASLESLPALRGVAAATVIDVGANIGQFALLMSALRPNAVIHAFEPYGPSADRLARLFAGDDRLRLHRCAVGDRDGEATLYVSRRPDNSSLLPIGPEQVRFAPGTETASTQRAPVRTLDAALDGIALSRPILLKLDVQGGELAALRGARRLLASVDYIYVEASFVAFYQGQADAAALLDFLRDEGFALAGLGGVARDRDDRIVQADFLLTRRPPG